MNPPGFFILTTHDPTGTPTTQGDSVHQIRFFIEVTGTTLDIKVFDAGSNSSRDLSGTVDTVYALYSPAGGAALRTTTIGNEIVATGNRLARFSCTGAVFQAANAGTYFGQAGCGTTISPGLYEFRVTVDDSSSNDFNTLGIDVRDASGNHYNVYTYGDSNNSNTAPGAGETSFIAGAMNAGTAPLANITQPMVLYPYVDRGCTVETSNFDMDSGAGNPGAGSSASITDALGAVTPLTMSGNATHAEDVVSVVPAGIANQEALNYGIYTITNDTGTQDNRAIDWRVADFQLGTDLGADFPRNPANPIRTYLPNGYGTAPVEPVLLARMGVVPVTGQPNPPLVGQTTRFKISASVYNPTGQAMTSVQVTVPLVTGAAFVSEAGYVDATPVSCSGAGAGYRRCTFASVPAGGSAAFEVVVNYTPTAAGLFNLTGAPAAGAPPPDTTVWAQYTPAFSSATFTRTETMGPVCQLAGVAYNPTVNLAVTKTDAPDPVQAGADITYTLVVSNSGPNAAGNVRLVDALPAGTTFQSVTATGWTCATPAVGVNGTVSCTRASLAAAGSSTITLVARVASGTATGTTITNTATVSSDGVDGNLANNTATATTSVGAALADLAVTKTDAPDPVYAGQNITYTITISNDGPSDAAGLTLADSVPAPTTFQAIVASGWTCSTPAVGASGAIGCTRASLAAGASTTLSLLVAAGGSAGSQASGTVTVSATTTDPNAANNSASATTTVAIEPSALCATPGNDGVLAAATAETVVNTYHPVTASAGSGATTLTLGAAVGATTPIAIGDLLLVIQMQDAAIDSSNTGAYGDGSAGDPARGSTDIRGSGLYEFVRAASAVGLGGGTLTLQGAGTGGGLVNAYTNAAATGTDGQRRFQVIRVPQYTSATFGSGLTALRWNGTAGGVLVLDVAGTLNLNNAAVSVSGRGFHGGAGRGLTGGGGTGTATDYRNPATVNLHGAKGEGIAGRPRYLSTAPTIPVTGMTRAGGTVTVTTLYPHGFATGNTVYIQGADQWQYNGTGASGWAWTITVTGTTTFTFNIGALTPAVTATGTIRVVLSGSAVTTDTGVEGYPNGSQARGAPGIAGGGGTDTDVAVNQENSGGGGGGNGGIGGQGGNAWQSGGAVGGFGGAAFGASATRMVMGGGGGAGTRNNSANVRSAGGAGGGIVFIRAGALSGTGEVWADGDPGWQPDNDGGGGGGAGGTVVVTTANGSLAGLTVRAQGGRGADAWPSNGGGLPARHGPGGGGAGGFVLTSSAPTATAVTGGVNGISTTLNDAFGSGPGAAGQSALISGVTIPGFSSGTACSADLSITKDDSPDPTLLGQVLTYSLVVTNNGYRAATSVSVSDPIPPVGGGLSFLSASTTQGSCTTPDATCSIGTLASGASATITIQATTTTTGTITNTASVSSATPDPSTANDTATATTTVNAAADLAVSIIGTPEPVLGGGTITYTVVVSNGGPSAAAAPTLTIPIPAGATFASVTPPAGWTCPTTPAVGGTGNVVCTAAADLASGGSASFSLVTTVPLGTAPGSLIVATATVATTTGELVTSNNQATATNSVGPAPALLTRATLRGLRVDPAGLVEFATGMQRRTRSFNLYATADPDGEEDLVLLNAEPVLAERADTNIPTLYSVQTDPITLPYLLIVETDTLGRRQFLGPFSIDDTSLRHAFERIERRLEATGDARESGRSAQARSRTVSERAFARAERVERERGPGRSQVRPRRVRGTDQAVEIVTRGFGRAAVARADLEAAGLPADVSLLRSTLSSRGEAVAFRIEAPGTPAEALVFTASPFETAYTGRNVYVLSWGRFTPGLFVTLSYAEPPPAPGYTRVKKPSLHDGTMPIGTDPWLWDYVWDMGGQSWPYPDSLPGIGSFDLPGLSASPAADVPVRAGFWMWGDVDHQISVTLNGVPLGTARRQGSGPLVIEGRIPAAALRAEGNALGLVYTGAWEGVATLRWLDLAAPLDAAVATATVDAVEGYDSRVDGLMQADYLIVTHPDLAAEAQRIGELKRQEGRRVAVVEADNAYDRYSAGVVEPAAVAALIREAYTRGRLRDVLIVGDDTLDPFGYAAGEGTQTPVPGAFIPSLHAWSDESGRVPSENLFADVDGNGTPDVAIGRLPAQSAEEAQVLADKIARQRATLAASAGRHVVAVDNSRKGQPSFLAEAQSALTRFPWAQATWVDIAKKHRFPQLNAALAGGAALSHYFGHGGLDIWADEQLLTVDQAASLTNPETVFFVWACYSQWYTWSYGPSVNEALLLDPEGGALATFGPAGITDLAEQAALYGRLYDELRDPTISLGEAIRRAKTRAVLEDPRSRPAVEGWSLLGDPALQLGNLGASR